MSDLLTADQIRDALAGLDGWDGGPDGLSCTYEFDGYRPAVAFAVRVAMEAENVDHHPDMMLTWGKVEISVVTHSAGGVTDKDLDLARTIAGLPR